MGSTVEAKKPTGSSRAMGGAINDATHPAWVPRDIGLADLLLLPILSDLVFGLIPFLDQGLGQTCLH